MPLTIPPFAQFQGTLFPLRGLWHQAPAEGDRFVAAEIDWGSYPPGQGVQFALSGNSPVSLSQIIALSVDNARCGSDVQFIFADSAFTLQVPARCQGVFPVFTNGLNFYAVALNAVPSDITTINVHNSNPPQIQLLPTAAQNHATVQNLNLSNGTQVVLPSTVSGTLNGISLAMSATAAGSAGINLADSRGDLWAGTVVFVANEPTQFVNLADLGLRFVGGLTIQIFGSTVTGSMTANVYYTVP